MTRDIMSWRHYLFIIEVGKDPSMRHLGVGNFSRAIAIVIMVATYHVPFLLQ